MEVGVRETRSLMRRWRQVGTRCGRAAGARSWAEVVLVGNLPRARPAEEPVRGERAGMRDPAAVAWRRRCGTARHSLVCRRLGNGTKPSFGEATRALSVGRWGGGQNESVMVHRQGIRTRCHALR